MSIAIDFALVAIILLCAWRGFRTGIINGVCWIVAVIIAVYGANLVATAFCGDFADMLEPFALGVVEDTIESDDEKDHSIISPDMTAQEREKLDVYDVTRQVVERLGIAQSAVEPIAREIAGRHDRVGTEMASDLTELLCARAAFVALFAIAFALISIVFTVIGNILDLSFGLPGHENLNHITGAALGVIRGLMIVLVLGCLGRYLGILIRGSTASGTVIWRRIVEVNKLAEILHL